MRLARITILLSLIVSAALLGWHWMGLPSYPIGGWLLAPRVEKIAFFEINGTPFEQDSWSSRWGLNRPREIRPHAILSEIEVQVQHETRSGLVTVRVTGDSEEEVDAFIHTLQSDVENTYTSGDFRTPNHGHTHGDSGDYQPTHFWRQNYLWLLCVNIVIFSLLWLATLKKKKRQAEQGGDGDAEEAV